MTKTTDDKMARLDAAIERLEALGLTGPVISPTAVNPDGSPGHVAPGELIESAWGNAVSDEFQRRRAWATQLATGGGPFAATPTDFPGLNISLTIATGKLYKFSAFVPLCSVTANAIASIQIVSSGGVQNTGRLTVTAPNEFSLYTSFVVGGNGAAITAKVQMACTAGSMSAVGGTGLNSYILCEELGKQYTP